MVHLQDLLVLVLKEETAHNDSSRAKRMAFIICYGAQFSNVFFGAGLHVPPSIAYLKVRARPFKNCHPKLPMSAKTNFPLVLLVFKVLCCVVLCCAVLCSVKKRHHMTPPKHTIPYCHKTPSLSLSPRWFYKGGARLLSLYAPLSQAEQYKYCTVRYSTVQYSTL